MIKKNHLHLVMVEAHWIFWVITTAYSGKKLGHSRPIHRLMRCMKAEPLPVVATQE
jgi:hypothetical protein